MSVDLAAVFAQFGDAYRTHAHLNADQQRALHAVLACRTPALGLQRHRCDHCAFEHHLYRSCRNRHCPKCQGAVRAAWVADRCEDVLEVPYFHLVFTLPHELNALARAQPRQTYARLFDVAWHTLRSLARDRLGGELGMTAVLHTWGQTLTQHVHLHCLIAGGAFDARKGRWQRVRSRYLVPVKVMQRLFRGRMVSALRLAAAALPLPAERLDALLDALMSKTWSVYAKPVLGHPHQLLDYLGRYTYRIAIGNERLLALSDTQVSFRYRDHRDGGKHKVMALDGAEFMRRYLQHVVPRGFMRVRHFGFLGNRVRRKTLARIRALLPPRQALRVAVRPASAQEHRCPQCGVGMLRFVAHTERTLIDSS